MALERPCLTHRYHVFIMTKFILNNVQYNIFLNWIIKTHIFRNADTFVAHSMRVSVNVIQYTTTTNFEESKKKHTHNLSVFLLRLIY